MTVPILCLSSAKHPRYRDDVIRAVALPEGSEVKFRYEEAIVDDALMGPLAKGKLDENDVLIAHVDISDKDEGVSVVPCRWAHLVSSQRWGSFFVLQLRLGKLACTLQPDELYTNLPGDLPYFDAALGKWAGKWCGRLARETTAIGEAETTEEWQSVARALWQRAGFQTEPFFFRVDGLFKLGNGAEQPLTGEGYALTGNTEYEIRIVHFTPVDDEHSDQRLGPVHGLHVEVDEPLKLRSDQTMSVDSPYDVKSIRFATGSPDRTVPVKIRLRRIDGSVDGDPLCPIELVLPARIKGRLRRSVTFGLLIGGLLSAQQLVTILTRENSSALPIESIIALTVFIGLMTGLMAVLGLRKPL